MQLQGQPMDDYSTLTAWIGHSLSSAAIVGTLVGWFPVVAALAAFIWYIIQIYESRTFQHWYANMQMKRRARKLARLQAKERIVLAKIEAIEKVRVASVEARELVATAKVDAAKIVVTGEIDLNKNTPPI